MRKLKSADDLEILKDNILSKHNPEERIISICCGTGCRAYKAHKVAEAFKQELEKSKLKKKVIVKTTGCHGFCERGPLVVFHPEKIFYQHVAIEDVPEIVEKTINNGEIIERLLYPDPKTGKPLTYEYEIPFYKWQHRKVFGNNGLIDPTSIEDYISLGGYSAFAKAVSGQNPEGIIEDVKKSGLRGRGGAGFPTGKKWEFLAIQEKKPKYIVCNGDEGDPGAYMDRSLLEGNPQSVIEGMLIGAYSTGASHGYIYVRTEYPLAIQHLHIALNQARELGLLGNNILNTKFSFDIQLVQGAGAFVCGEETALIRSIEGRRSAPVIRPPFPVEKGINGYPTMISNVETWANIPIILREGSKKYVQTGVGKSTGTKIFSLVGKIKNTGLVEVPMGITIRDIVEKIGGGAPDNAQVKAIQTGGPSGGCIPASLFDLTIDYESLVKAGSMMGSGGLIVMDENTCMVDLARYFLEFTKNESCGKCTFCRIGTKRMLEILERITAGEGKDGDIEKLEDLAYKIKTSSLCGLGQTAPNPVLTTLKYFRSEYEAHIYEKKCPAKTCTALISYKIDEEKCTGCRACVKKCPVNAISGEVKKAHTIDKDICIKCGVCISVCKFEAVIKI